MNRYLIDNHHKNTYRNYTYLHNSGKNDEYESIIYNPNN